MSQTPARPAVARPSVLSLSITSKSALYASYMPFILNGGFFLPTSKSYKLGDEVFMLLQLMDDPTKHPVAGKVIWVTSSGAQGGKTSGVGIQFKDDDAGKVLRGNIEKILAGALNSNRPTHTL